MGQSDDIARAEGTVEYIERRADQTLFFPPQPTGEPRNFFYGYEYADGLHDLVGAVPGSDKSRVATEIANRLWQEKHEPTLYLMLTHDAIKERLKFINRDRKGDFWRHFQGHAKTCKVSLWAKAGYTGAQCTRGCEIGSLEPDKPTLAALDVVLINDVNPWAFHEDVQFFPLWIIDEVDFGRFVGESFAPEADIRAVASRYPDRTAPLEGTPLSLLPVKQLAQALLDVLAGSAGTEWERLNGKQLYQAIDMALVAKGSGLRGLVAQLKPVSGKLPTGRWARKSGGTAATLAGQPHNFPPYLVPIFCEEATNFLGGKHFNARIHLVSQGDRPPLRVRWRREAVDTDVNFGQGNRLKIDFMVLDATADRDLLEYVFPHTSIKGPFRPPSPEWPANVHVHQWAGSIVSKKELGFYNDDSDDVGPDASKREKWYDRIREALDGLDRRWQVGVITHKDIREELAAKVRTWGFKTVKSMYFGNLRGSNEFEKSRILVVLGCPIPNLTGFEEECQAFFYDYPKPLNFHRNPKALDLEMRDGRKFPVQVYGSWEPPVSAYYQQKCQAELYQALHRIRPYIRKRYDRHIFLFTNMPVPDAKVDEVLVDTAKNRNWPVAQKVKELLAGAEVVTVKEVALLVAKDGQNPRNVGKTIDNNGDAIAILAGAWFYRGTPGRGGESNRFAKNPITL